MINYIVPAILALAVGLILWLVKRKRLRLQYDIVGSDEFPREDGTGKYFVCELSNNGNHAIENISFEIDVNKGKIDSVKYSNTQLFNVNQQTDTLIAGIVPLLNPKERFSTILTIKDAEKDSNINIAARAVGATATKKPMRPYLKTYLMQQ